MRRTGARYINYRKEIEIRLRQPVPVIVILKLNEDMLLLIDEETDSVSVALTESPGSKL